MFSDAHHASLKHEKELDELREKLARAERERDEYKNHAHELGERIGRMTNAATSAAATAEAAINQLIGQKPVLDAAIALAERYALRSAPLRPELTELLDAVKMHQRGLPS